MTAEGRRNLLRALTAIAAADLVGLAIGATLAIISDAINARRTA